jgi:hypothetical protein
MILCAVHLVCLWCLCPYPFTSKNIIELIGFGVGVFQDYKVHRDEIHSKLVAIMKERLLVHLKTLPQVAETWNRPDDGDNQPSQYARTLTKVGCSKPTDLFIQEQSEFSIDPKP